MKRNDCVFHVYGNKGYGSYGRDYDRLYLDRESAETRAREIKASLKADGYSGAFAEVHKTQDGKNGVSRKIYVV